MTIYTLDTFFACQFRYIKSLAEIYVRVKKIYTQNEIIIIESNDNQNQKLGSNLPIHVSESLLQPVDVQRLKLSYHYPSAGQQASEAHCIHIQIC